MRRSILLFFFLAAASPAAAFLDSRARLGPAGAIVKHLSLVLKWTKSSPKTTQHDGNMVEFESGYFVETLVEGNKLGMVPHTIRVSPEGELFAVDAINNNIVRITPPLSQYSRARLVAGSFQGYSGHVDGKPSDARFYHPKGVTMDDKGNVYVADTSNLAIRKISEAGVTTIAGGKSNTAGYRDGPSEDAKFSTDFDVVYDGRTCSLIVIDRGNAALRQIYLQQEDCEYQYSSVSTTDISMVIGAVIVGYISCLLQQGFGPLIPSKNQAFVSARDEDSSLDKPAVVVESLKEEPGAGWPSLGRLLVDLSKFAFEGIGSMLLNFIPLGLFGKRTGLTPLKDHLVIPEEKTESPLVQKQKSPLPMSETIHEPNVVTDTAPKPQKTSKIPKFKDTSLPSKHRSSKRQDYADFYGSGDVQVSSKPSKDRVRHSHREKNSEALFGAVATEPKSVESKSADYGDSKFDHYNFRSKYGPGNTFRY